jgi:hypothetical protein
MKPLRLFYPLAFVAAVYGTPNVGDASPKALQKNYISNPGFESQDSARSGLPSGWDVDVANKTDALEIVARDSTIRHCGKVAARIRFNEAMNYSGVIQRISAADFAGKEVEFSGFIRRSSEKSMVGIWLMATNNKNNKLIYVNSYEQPVNQGLSWTRHALSLRIPKEASFIKIGAAIYEKDGIMWADDLNLSDISVKPIANTIVQNGRC